MDKVTFPICLSMLIIIIIEGIILPAWSLLLQVISLLFSSDFYATGLSFRYLVILDHLLIFESPELIGVSGLSSMEFTEG